MKKSSTVVIVSAVFSLPAGTIPALLAQQPTPAVKAAGRAQSPASVVLRRPANFDKWRTTAVIVGIDNGNAIYQNERAEQFTLDPVTGDMIFVDADQFAQFTDKPPRARPGTPLRMYKWSPTKFSGPLAILGVDQAGHVIHQDGRGAKFYLDPATGDMVFVK